MNVSITDFTKRASVGIPSIVYEDRNVNIAQIFGKNLFIYLSTLVAWSRQVQNDHSSLDLLFLALPNLLQLLRCRVELLEIARD